MPGTTCDRPVLSLLLGAISARNFCFRRLMTLSTEFTELPRALAISSLEKPRAFRWKIRASSGVRLASISRSSRCPARSVRLSRPRLAGADNLRSRPRLDAVHANLHRAAPWTTRRCSPAPSSVASQKLLDRSRLAFPFLDPSHRLLEDLGDLHFVLDCGKPSSEPRQEIVERLEQTALLAACHRHRATRTFAGSPYDPSRTWPLGDAGQGNDASVGPPEEREQRCQVSVRTRVLSD